MQLSVSEWGWFCSQASGCSAKPAGNASASFQPGPKSGPEVPGTGSAQSPRPRNALAGSLPRGWQPCQDFTKPPFFPNR